MDESIDVGGGTFKILIKTLAQLTQALLTYGPRFKVAQYYSREDKYTKLGHLSLIKLVGISDLTTA